MTSKEQAEAWAIKLCHAIAKDLLDGGNIESSTILSDGVLEGLFTDKARLDWLQSQKPFGMAQLLDSNTVGALRQMIDSAAKLKSL